MGSNRIRPLVLAIIKKDNKILVCVGYDSKKNEKFYRLPGGGIEFGETGVVALNREFKEEFDSNLKNQKFLGFLENIFTYEGVPGHELVMIFKADLIKESLYDEKEIKILDDDSSYAVWEDIDILENSNFYPDGVRKFI